MPRKSLDEIFGTASNTQPQKKSLDEIFGTTPKVEKEETNYLDKALGAVSAFDKGYTAGFGRKVGGVLNAIGGAPVEALLTDKTLSESAKDKYKEIVGGADTAEEQFAKENPVISAGTNIAGAFLNPINKLLPGGKAESLIGKVGKGALTNAGVGAIYGAGRVKSLEDLPKAVTEDALTGALIGGALPVAGKVYNVAKKGGKELLGLTTGTGERAVEQAFEAGKRGSNKFLENMRGKVEKDNIVYEARNYLDRMYKNIQSQYKNVSGEINKDAKILKLDNVYDKFNDLVKSHYVGKFAKGGENTQKAFQKIKDVIDEFSQDPSIHTVEGFDALKRRLYDITFPLEERQANSIVKQMAGTVKDEINKQAPLYSKMMKDYSDGFKAYKEIEKTLSLAENKPIDTALRKLQSSFRNNVSSNYGNRGDLVKELGGEELSDAIAGQLMETLFPRGMIGKLAGGGALFTGNLPAISASSPRLVGEMAYKLGQASKYTPKNINVNPTALWLSLAGEK